MATSCFVWRSKRRPPNLQSTTKPSLRKLLPKLCTRLSTPRLKNQYCSWALFGKRETYRSSSRFVVPACHCHRRHFPQAVSEGYEIHVKEEHIIKFFINHSPVPVIVVVQEMVDKQEKLHETPKYHLQDIMDMLKARKRLKNRIPIFQSLSLSSPFPLMLLSTMRSLQSHFLINNPLILPIPLNRFPSLPKRTSILMTNHLRDSKTYYLRKDKAVPLHHMTIWHTWLPVKILRLTTTTMTLAKRTALSLRTGTRKEIS